MTTEERVLTLEAVMKTLDHHVCITGISNMEAIIACSAAIQKVASDMRADLETEVKD